MLERLDRPDRRISWREAYSNLLQTYRTAMPITCDFDPHSRYMYSSNLFLLNNCFETNTFHVKHPRVQHLERTRSLSLPPGLTIREKNHTNSIR